MKKVYYLTLSSLLDVSLCFSQYISRMVSFRMVVQVTGNNWKSNVKNSNTFYQKHAISPAFDYLNQSPASLRNAWDQLEGFYIAHFGGGNGLHPASIVTSLKIVHDARAFCPDLIHLETTSGRLLWALPSLRKIAPIVVTVHDPIPHSGEKPLKKLLIRMLTYRQISRYILHNKSQTSDFLTHYKVPHSQIAYTPLGEYQIYPHYLNQTINSDPKTVLFFGRISPYKGIEVLFQSIPLICEKLAGVHFIIAGSAIPGYTLPPLPALSNGGTIELIQDYISTEKLAELFSRATIVACPYIDATQSGVVMVAYTFNKPVIATDTGGLPEYVQDGLTGRLVPPGNASLLTEAAIDLLTDESARRKMAAHIRQKCDTVYNWQTISAQTNQIYQQIIQDGLEKAA